MEKTIEVTAVPAIWRQAFRPFFLAGSAFSIFALILWGGTLSGNNLMTPYPHILFWHGHEMLFGFVAAIIVGFLLTAVQSWTGLRATHGKPLMALFALWLAGRLLMLFGTPKMGLLIVIVDVSFLPAAAALVGRLVIKANNHRNLQFIPILLLLTAANLFTHLSVLLERPGFYVWGMYAAIMVVTLLMVVLGGRVIPFFTERGTPHQSAAPIPWLEKTTLVSTWLIALFYIANAPALIPEAVLAAIFFLAAAGNAFRALRWQGWLTFRYPLVWPLHLAYWFIPVGFFLFGLQNAGFQISPTAALHSLTAGAMGTLILAMIARVSLGHTGRALVPHKSVAFAFGLILFAGIVRLLVGLFPATFPPISGYLLSAGLWIAAYGIYFIVNFGILTTARPDGKPG